MNNQQNTLKQEFILELMVFSAEYNAVNAAELADQLKEEQLTQYIGKLRTINEKEAQDLAELEESNPDIYEQRIKEREDAEIAADEAFYNKMEGKVATEEESADKELADTEKDLNTINEKTGKQLDETYKAADDMLDALFKDDADDDTVQAAQPQVNQPEPDRSVSEIQTELKSMVDKTKSNLPPHDPTEEVKRDNWQ